ncbi:MAG: hypothetical protein ABJQ71_05685 [Roseibium sp.]
MNKIQKKQLLAFAEELYGETDFLSPQKQLSDFLNRAAQYNLKTFFCSFLCYGTFGHSQPDRLDEQEISLFIMRADPFLQAAILQRSMMQ